MKIIGTYPIPGRSVRYLVRTRRGHLVVAFDKKTSQIRIRRVGPGELSHREVTDAIHCISARLAGSSPTGSGSWA
jgi:hypothetical protein